MRRYRKLIGELARFGSVGVLCVAVNIALYNLLRFGLEIESLTSNALAMVVSTSIGYVANRYWTFRESDESGMAREYVLFFVLNGVGFVITEAVLWLAHYAGFDGELTSNAALLVGIGLATVFRYWGYKRWVFRESAAEEPVKVG
ncbi:GtrA family protein [Actinocorallia sp. B10E7]|uniref:GtrA family protein n=1 Tax=Actinocorallia sp. B10E7 TaxID=3153558 RepID=UPI00325D1F7E